MSWLQDGSSRSSRDQALQGATSTCDPVEGWTRQLLCIETDESGQLLIDTRATGARWVHTYSTRNLLEARSTADFDAVHCVEWTGAQLRGWLREHAPDAGALHHADRYT